MSKKQPTPKRATKKRAAKKPTRKPAGALTPKQLRFVAEYLVDLNATQAAIRAGYSQKTAYSAGQRLLKNVEIQKIVSAGKAQQLHKADVTAERVLAEIAKLCFSDVRKLYREDGSLKKPGEWDDETAAAVAALEVVEMAGGAGIHVPMYTKKVKLWDKKGALELLAKHFALLIEKVEHSGAVAMSWQSDES